MPRKNRRLPDQTRKTKRRLDEVINTQWRRGNLSPLQFNSLDRNLDNGVDARDTTTGAY